MKIIKSSTISDCVENASIYASNYNGLNKSKCYVFCEDKITLSLELEIAKKCGGGFFNVEVSTFNRYILSKNANVNVLSKESSVMAVRKIILNKQKELTCFSNLKYCPNLSVTVYELISQLASAKVTPNDLSKLINEDEARLGGALTNKLKDIALIYGEYLSYLKQRGFVDRNDYISLMPSLIENDNELDGATVILVGFSSVTRQRYDVFKALNNKASEVYAFIVAGEEGEFYTNETYNRLLELEPNATVTNTYANLSNELNALKKYLFNPLVFKSGYIGVKSDNVEVIEYPEIQREVEETAKNIVKQVKLNGKRYKNIAIMVGDLNSYKLQIAKTFSEYKIPYYIDKAGVLADHPICSYITDFIDLTRKNLAVNETLNFISNGMFLPNKNITDKFKVYAKKYALTRKSFKEPFKYKHDNLSDFEIIREKVYNAYLGLDSASTVTEYVNAVKNMLEITGVEGNIESYNKKLTEYGELTYADFNDKILEKVNRLLDETVAVLGNVKISLLDFKTVFLSGASSTSIGSIPLFNDAVYVGECKDVKIKRAEVLFAIGINGNVPFSKSDTALLTDGDLASLDKFSVIVEPKIKIVNKREKENVCTAFMSFNQKLFVSFSNLGADGKTTVKSEIISYLLKIFNLKIQSFRKKAYIYNEQLNEGETDNTINEYIADKYLSSESALREIAKLKQNANVTVAGKILASFYDAVKDNVTLDEKAKMIETRLCDKPEFVSKANICLRGEEISATTLEEYFACPYSNFIKNALKLKSSETGEMQHNEIGTMLHELVELYAKRVEEVTSKETSDAIVEEITASIYAKEEYAKYLEKPSYKYVFNKMLKEGKKACYDVYKTFKDSGFKPYLFEAKFGKDKPREAISLTTKTGNYKVKGAIDRVDIADDKIRIIDYKSGKVHPDNESFYTGNNLQLYLYMNALTREGFIPAGAYYFPIKDDYVNEEDVKSFIMHGNTVNDAEILKLSDYKLGEGKNSDIVNVKLTSKGVPHTSWSKVLSRSEMNAYVDYALKIASKGVDEINAGYIKATPYNPKNKCAYCEYAGLCSTNLKETDGRKVSDIKTQTVVDAVEYENNKNNDTEGNA